jgi:soluble lytic murein transglycosylase
MRAMLSRAGLILIVLLLLPVHLTAKEFPRILSDRDAATYQRIFDLQISARWRDADREIKGLTDRILMGHVLYQRYMHPTGWRSKYAQLHGWLASYADHPLAEKIYRLAQRRRPASGWKSATKPRVSRLTYPKDLPLVLTGTGKRGKLKPSRTRRDLSILKQVRRNVLRDRMTVTEKMLATEGRRMTPAALSEARAQLARGHLSAYRFDRVIKQSELAIRGEGGGKRLGAYHAGLAFWAQDLRIDALKRFRIAAQTPPDRIGNIGGAVDYWHARAALSAGLYDEALAALEKATAWPRDLYGQLAHAQLIRFRPYEWSPAQSDGRIMEALLANQPVRRALALAEAGQISRADMELTRLMRRADRGGGALLMVAAGAMAAPSSAYRLARIRRRSYGEIHDPALYPLPSWRIVEEAPVNRALLLAVARRESGYNPQARSSAGARGLMQLMPGTASYIAGKNGFASRELRQLDDPEISLKYGHAYLTYLSKLVKPRGCIIHMLAAYNAGPGNLQKWERKFGDRHDPLLFIELMGSRETRQFVKDVLAAYWVYRDRLGEPVPSQELLAQGRWPVLPAIQTSAAGGTATGGNSYAN